MRKVIVIRDKSPSKVLHTLKEAIEPSAIAEFERLAMEARAEVATVTFDSTVAKEYVEWLVKYQATPSDPSTVFPTSVHIVMSGGVSPLNTWLHDFIRIHCNTFKGGKLNPPEQEQPSFETSVSKATSSTRNALWVAKLVEIGGKFVEVSTSKGRVNYDWNRLKRHPKKPKPTKKGKQNVAYGVYIHVIEERGEEDDMLLLTVSDGRAGYGNAARVTRDATILTTPNADVVTVFSHAPYYTVAVVDDRYYPVYALLQRQKRMVLGLIEQQIPQFSIDWINEAVGGLI